MTGSELTIFALATLGGLAGLVLLLSTGVGPGALALVFVGGGLYVLVGVMARVRLLRDKRGDSS